MASPEPIYFVTICLRCRTELTIYEIQEGICLICAKEDEHNIYDDFFVDDPPEPKKPFFTPQNLGFVLAVDILLLIVTLMVMYGLNRV